MTNGQFRKYYSHIEENWDRKLHLKFLKLRTRKDGRRALVLSTGDSAIVIEESPDSDSARGFIERDKQPRRVFDNVLEAIYRIEDGLGYTFSEELGLELLLESPQ